MRSINVRQCNLLHACTDTIYSHSCNASAAAAADNGTMVTKITRSVRWLHAQSVLTSAGHIRPNIVQLSSPSTRSRNDFHTDRFVASYTASVATRQESLAQPKAVMWRAGFQLVREWSPSSVRHVYEMKVHTDYKCVRKPTKSRLTLTHRAKKSSR